MTQREKAREAARAFFASTGVYSLPDVALDRFVDRHSGIDTYKPLPKERDALVTGGQLGRIR